MDIPKTELFAVLQEFNPWWSGQPIQDLPLWQRSVSRAIWDWVQNRKTRRALMLNGARQVGKTTLFRQAIRRLVKEGFPPANVLFATFDHPILKLAGLARTLEAWEELYAAVPGHPRYLFLDEIQYAPDWQTWLKHQVDFQPSRRIAVTGSATPLRDGATESGVGRWESLPLPTLSFGEYLHLRKIAAPTLPAVQSLRELFTWTEADFAKVGAAARGLTVHFHDYLLRGGFPEPAQEDDLVRCQRLLREDIVDKVLKRDMTALYGVRRVLEAEKIFLYLCYHDGGILDIATLCRELDGVNKQTANNLLDLFEATHLIYRLKPHGYGKEVLRGRDKVYLADAAIPGAVMLLGRKLLEQPERLGAAVETAFFKHAYTWFFSSAPKFTYWRDKKNKDYEVDLISELGDRLVPFEVKYRDEEFTGRSLTGMRHFLEKHKVTQGYVIQQRWEDFGIHQLPSARAGEERTLLDAKVLAIPAPLACYWLSKPGDLDD